MYRNTEIIPQKKTIMKERLLKFLEYLGIGQLKFEMKTGLSRGFVNKVADNITLKSVNKICEAYPQLNRNWLLTGEGSMLNNESATDVVHVNNSQGVPYYDIDVTGSVISSFQDVQEKPEFFVDFRPFNDCTAYLPIYGDSMYPQFCSGEIVVIKEWPNKNVLLWGEPYLIVTNEICNSLRTVKLVFPAEERGYITLRASNPNFKGDTIIPLDCIISLYIIKGKITRKQL